MTDLESLARLLCPRDALTGCKNVHLGIFAEPYLQRIYTGEKTVESRFTKNRITPWGKVKRGDLVLLKRSGGPVEAYFTVGAVVQYDLAQTPLAAVRERHEKALCVDDGFWQAKSGARYAVLMEIRELRRISPQRIDKKGMQTWITQRMAADDPSSNQ